MSWNITDSHPYQLIYIYVWACLENRDLYGWFDIKIVWYVMKKYVNFIVYNGIVEHVTCICKSVRLMPLKDLLYFCSQQRLYAAPINPLAISHDATATVSRGSVSAICAWLFPAELHPLLSESGRGATLCGFSSELIHPGFVHQRAHISVHVCSIGSGKGLQEWGKWTLFQPHPCLKRMAFVLGKLLFQTRFWIEVRKIWFVQKVCSKHVVILKY